MGAFSGIARRHGDTEKEKKKNKKPELTQSISVPWICEIEAACYPRVSIKRLVRSRGRLPRRVSEIDVECFSEAKFSDGIELSACQ